MHLCRQGHSGGKEKFLWDWRLSAATFALDHEDTLGCVAAAGVSFRYMSISFQSM